MNLNEIETKSFIMALFIRDDKLRFLLGTGAYEFKDSQLMFAGNTIENDIVSVQGNDGYMLAGQVRRPNTQVFNGYIGDATVQKSEVESYRRDFMAFFQKNHFYTVVYIMADGSAVQRRRGFLVDAPTSQEIWQMYPEYHVALNFEDINYYKYSENDEGEETYAKSAEIGLARVQYGGLIWANDSDITFVGTGAKIMFTGTVDDRQINSVQLKGDTQQQTYSGKNLLLPSPKSAASSGLTASYDAITGVITLSGTASNNWSNAFNDVSVNLPAGTYTFSATTEAGLGRNIIFFNGSTNILQKNISATATSVECVVPQAITSLRLWLTPTNGTNYTGKTFRAQLESGSTPTSFEPYVGGVASPNPGYPQEIQTVTGEQTITVTDDSSQSQSYPINLGKNLFDKDDANIISAYIAANNPRIVAGADNDTIYISCEQNTTYTVSKISDNVFRVGTTQSLPSDSVTVNDFVNATTSTSATITTSANAKYIVVFLHNAQSSNSLADILESLQIEKGSSATTYTPYIRAFGKNLCNGINQGYWVGATTNMTYGRSSGNTGLIIPVESNTNYTISTTATQTRYRVGLGDEVLELNGSSTIYDKVLKDGTSDSVTLSSGNHKYIVVNATYLTKIQVEKGSSATTYEPNISGQLELYKISTYQDYIYKSGNDWYMHKEIGSILYNGTESWNRSNAGWFYVSSQSASSINGIPNATLGYSNHYIFDSAQSAYYGFKFGNSNYIQITHTSITTAADYKTWLASNNVIFYYPLATPTDTQITNSALIAQLEALSLATTYDRITWFKSSSEYLPTIMTVSLTATTGGGIVWDNYGAVWEEGGGGEAVIVNVDSIENIFPVWTINGKAENPTLTNLTTGMSITYNGTVASGQTLVIDLLNRTAKLDGTSVISDISGQWVEFQPGNNKISYSADNADAPNSTIEWQEVVG